MTMVTMLAAATVVTMLAEAMLVTIMAMATMVRMAMMAMMAMIVMRVGRIRRKGKFKASASCATSTAALIDHLPTLISILPSAKILRNRLQPN